MFFKGTGSKKRGKVLLSGGFIEGDGRRWDDIALGQRMMRG